MWNIRATCPLLQCRSLTKDTVLRWLRRWFKLSIALLLVFALVQAVTNLSRHTAILSAAFAMRQNWTDQAAKHLPLPSRLPETQRSVIHTSTNQLPAQDAGDAKAARGAARSTSSGLPASQDTIPTTGGKSHYFVASDKTRHRATSSNGTSQGDTLAKPGDVPAALPLCPEFPPHPKVVLRPSNQTVPDPALLESRFAPFLGSGGDYSPKDCQARQRVAIIIAYRNRWRHLLVLLNNLVPFLVRQHVSFTIFVIDQMPPTTFNRGMLQNIGFAEALKRDNYTCFILHDVDLIPLNDLNYYRCGPQPRHMAVGINKFHYRLFYTKYLGGAVALARDQMEKVNGMSNLYFGWGAEDDDLYSRIFHKGMRVVRYPASIGKYDMIKHQHDSGNEVNPLRRV